MSVQTSHDQPGHDLAAQLKQALRRLASTVTIVTSRDDTGQPHGMAASAVMPVSMDPPSLLVAVHRDAGLHPVLQQARRFCVNLLADEQHGLLTPFSQTALRAQRFRSDDWCDAWLPQGGALPWLHAAPASVECRVDEALGYGTHTLFIGRVLRVRCAADRAGEHGASPLVWLAGQRARLSLAAA